MSSNPMASVPSHIYGPHSTAPTERLPMHGTALSGTATYPPLFLQSGTQASASGPLDSERWVIQQLTQLRTEVKADIADVRAEVKADIADVRAGFRWGLGLLITVLVTVLVPVLIGLYNLVTNLPRGGPAPTAPGIH